MLTQREFLFADTICQQGQPNNDIRQAGRGNWLGITGIGRPISSWQKQRSNGSLRCSLALVPSPRYFANFLLHDGECGTVSADC